MSAKVPRFPEVLLACIIGDDYHFHPGMSSNGSVIVLPRPSTAGGPTAIESPSTVIAAPTEEAFIAEFGALLPPAQFLEVDQKQTAYYELPPKSKSVTAACTQRILLVHGVGTPALGLLPLAKALQASKPTAHIVLYDLYGHGLSSTPIAPHVPALFHDQIIQLLRRLDWPSAHLLGFSFGGSTVASFTAIHLNLVQSMVLVAPAGLLKSQSLTEEEQAYKKGGPGVDETAVRDWVKNWINGGPLVALPDWKARFANGEISGEPIQIWEREHHKGHLASIAGMLRDGGIFDMHNEFKKAVESGVKGTAVLGQLDDICTEQDVKFIGLNDVLVVPEAGHGLVKTHAASVANHVLNFWEFLN